MSEEKEHGSVADYRKTVLMKAMYLGMLTDPEKTIEITVNLPEYIISAIIKCNQCWSKEGCFNENFDQTLKAMLSDGLAFRFKNEFKDMKDGIKFVSDNLPTQCAVCMALGQ